MQILGALFPTHLTWGFNYWGIIKNVFSFTILGIAAILLIPPINSNVAKILITISTPILNKNKETHHYLLYLIFSIILFTIFYYFRSRASVYGDGFMVLDQHINFKDTFNFSTYSHMPLVILFHSLMYKILSQFLSTSIVDLLSAINATGGVFGFWALYHISKTLTSTVKGC